jgi:hypothetical protein
MSVNCKVYGVGLDNARSETMMETRLLMTKNNRPA